MSSLYVHTLQSLGSTESGTMPNWHKHKPNNMAKMQPEKYIAKSER